MAKQSKGRIVQKLVTKCRRVAHKPEDVVLSLLNNLVKEARNRGLKDELKLLVNMVGIDQAAKLCDKAIATDEKILKVCNTVYSSDEPEPTVNDITCSVYSAYMSDAHAVLKGNVWDHLRYLERRWGIERVNNLVREST